jgi:hypothetical protein
VISVPSVLNRFSFFLLLLVVLGLLSARAAAQIPSSAAIQRADSPKAQNSRAKCAPARFSGEVLRDQKYVHALPYGLEFRLIPYPEGWSISIGRPGDKTEDYVGIATPPYHGVNPVFIEAWHFRNADNTGPNEGQVEAPASVRDFSFVLSHAQYQKFLDELNIWSGSSPDATEKQRAAATDFLLSAPRRSGSLSIVDMKLGGLEKGTRPWFDSMKFNVDLCFPPPAAPLPEKNDAAKSPPPKKNP